MLNVLKEKNRIRAQFLRFEAYVITLVNIFIINLNPLVCVLLIQKLERVRSTESGSRVEQPHICRLCAIAYNGNEDEHRSCSVHRKLEVLLRPFCRICKLKFKSAIERESHRLTAEHLLAEEKADKIARADMDEVLEETNEDDLIESYLDQDPGMC
jgi:hypothetical protein